METAQSVPPNNPAPEGAGQTELSTVLTQVASAAVLVAFALYTIGFIIWRAHLAKYGVSSIAFLQTEYISAAFCYLFVLVVIAGPPALLFERWRLSRKGQKPDEFPTNVLLGIWYSLLIYLQMAFFPDSKRDVPPYLWALLGFGVLWLVGYIACVVWWRDSPLFKFLRITHAKIVVFITAIMMVSFVNTDLSMGYLWFTSLLYALYYFLTGIDSPPHDVWKKSNWILRTLVVALVGLVLLANVQGFGRAVFGVIPRRVGGGKPEKAFIQLDAQHTGVIPSLNVSTTNGLIGPVAILLRSEKEIVFVNYAQLTAPEFLTNLVTNSVMKVSFLLTTNAASLISTNVGTNGLVLLTTNIVETVHTNTFTNMIVSLTTNTVRNPNKFGNARQVRAEIVDAVIYSE